MTRKADDAQRSDSDKKNERLKAALKANIARRKEQAKARKGQDET